MEAPPRPAKVGVTQALSTCVVSRQQNHVQGQAKPYSPPQTQPKKEKVPQPSGK